MIETEISRNWNESEICENRLKWNESEIKIWNLSESEMKVKWNESEKNFNFHWKWNESEIQIWNFSEIAMKVKNFFHTFSITSIASFISRI